MTTKEQAKDLVKQFLTVKAETIVTPEGKYVKTMPYAHAQICATIAVENILKALYKDFYDSNNGAYEFWEQVQTEIQDI